MSKMARDMEWDFENVDMDMFMEEAECAEDDP